MKKLCMGLIVCLLLSVAATGLAEVESFSIAQIYQEHEDDTRLHVRLESTGAVNGGMTPLTAESIEKATIGTGSTPVLDVRPVSSEAGEGMTYMFILDHAMQTNAGRVSELKKGVNNWIDALGKNDCAAVIVSEEDEVRVLTDGFTSDKEALRSAVEGYGRANENSSTKNMIFSAIREGILMAADRAWERPRNCCIIVCSNGADTYQTLVTAEELTTLLSENNLPLYVVGFAYRNAKSSLASLVNIAKNSGGWSEDATPSNDQGTIDEAFDRLRTRILAGYDVTLDCSDGFVFNGSTLVSLKLRSPDVLLKGAADLYLLKKDDETPAPAAKAVQTAPPAAAAKSAAPDAGVSEAEPSGSMLSQAAALWNGETVVAGRLLPNRLLIALAAAAAVILAALLAGRVRQQKQAQPEPEPEPVPAAPSGNHAAPTLRALDTDHVRRTAPPADGADNAAPSPAPLASPSSHADRTQRTSIGHFEPQPSAAEKSIQELTIRFTLPGQSTRTEVFKRPLAVSIGRGVNNTLVLPCAAVSSNHAIISCENGEVIIANVSEIRNGQRNDLYVSRQQVEEKAFLPNNCRVNIGTVAMDISYVLSDSTDDLTDMDDDGLITARKPRSTEIVTERPIELEVSWSLRGRSGTQKIPLVRQAYIGRSESDTVTIPDPEATVSQHHVLLVRRGTEILVRNGSRDVPGQGRNPFYFNERGIVDEIPFEDGMTLYLGDAKVTLRHAGR